MVCERGQTCKILQRKVQNIYIPVNSSYPSYTKKMAQKNYNSNFEVFEISFDFCQQRRFLKVSKLYLFELLIKFDGQADS